MPGSTPKEGAGTVFYTHTLGNGLQIVGQPMPDFDRWPSRSMCVPVRVMNRTRPLRASPIS